jgi:biotin operon repressor
MALQEILSSLTSCNKEAGSFTLTKLWIEKAEELELSATAVSVMTALLWHYNPAKKYVYPHQETISKRIKRSIATVKRAISELKRAGYIVSSRTRNGNLYAFTQVLFDTLKPPVCTDSTATNEPSMNHEHVREQKNNNKAVVVSLKDFKGVEGETQGASSTAVSVSSETYNLNEIPDLIIRKHERGEIRKLNAYWGSLRPAVKLEYWEQDTAEKEKARLKAERIKAEELQKEQERKEREEMRNAPPFTQTCTREEGWNFCMRFAKSGSMRQFLFRGLCADIIKRFNFDTEELVKQASKQ